MKEITKDKWIWMGHPAHFICARDCQFFMATKVGNYIVSTVGEYWPDRQVRAIHAQVHDPEWHAENNSRKGDDYDYAYMKRFGFEDIGFDRKYETMVFKAVESKMKGEKACLACPFQIESGSNVDEEHFNTAKDAYEGHLKLCEKYSTIE